MRGEALRGRHIAISKPFDLVEVKTRIHNTLEVRLLYKKLENYSKLLELAMQQSSAETDEARLPQPSRA